MFWFSVEKEMPLKKEQVPKFYQGIGMLASIRTSLEFQSFCMHVSLRTCTCKHLSRMLGEVLYPQVVCPYRTGCSSN